VTHLDLFSGIGGFAIAARWAGFKTIAFSEIEPYACRILARHWPDIPNLGDIRTIRQPPAATLITAGFPCQPFSVAGKRRGTADDRALWPALRQVIELCQPGYVLAENVTGIINMELDGVLSDLDGLGYTTWPFVIPACAVDARHRRERVWIMAYAERSNGSPVGTERIGTAGAGPLDESSGSGDGPEDVAHAHLAGSQRHRGLRECSGELSPGPSCWPDEGEWFAESGMGRVASRVPNRSHRLKALGNAIVPQVAYVILKAMYDHCRACPSQKIAVWNGKS
jgi:DNA (cytosine-5)-methyltransferase 1